MLPVVVALAACQDVSTAALESAALELEGPDVIDFGVVPAGTMKPRGVRIENTGRFSVESILVTAIDRPGFRVELTEPAPALQPGASVVLSLELIALEETGPVEFDLVFTPFAGGQPGPELVVPSQVHVTATGIFIEPNPLTIGPVAFGAGAEGVLTVTNIRETAMQVTAPNVALGRIEYDTVVTRGAFGQLPLLSGNILYLLEPGEERTMPIAYTAPPRPGDGKERATFRLAECDEAECEVQVTVIGEPDNIGPLIALEPGAISFGQVPAGNSLARTLLIGNDGGADLEVSDVVLQDPTGLFRLEPVDLPLIIEPKSFKLVEATFAPVEEVFARAEVQLTSNDPVTPDLTVPMTGASVVLPPCDFTVSPGALAFGLVPLEEEVRRTITVQNRGTDVCLFFDLRLERDDADLSVFTFVDPPMLPIELRPNESVEIQVAFRPLKPGVARARAIFGLSNPDRPRVEVELIGEGGEGLGLRCSPDRTIEVGDTTQLAMVEVATSPIVERRWEILSAPPGGIGTPGQWSPDPPDAAVVAFTPLIIGTYNIEATAIDEDGREASCDVAVNVQGRGFQITATWDGPGDVDLHLLRDTGAPWFSSDDCNFRNAEPIWDPTSPAASGANPFLDIDDTSGEGPENIRVEQPEVGQTYLVGIHNFERAAERVARVQIYCGVDPAARLDIESRPLRGRRRNECSTNDFWKVARVEFSSSTDCTVTKLDTYTTAEKACAAP